MLRRGDEKKGLMENLGLMFLISSVSQTGVILGKAGNPESLLSQSR